MFIAVSGSGRCPVFVFMRMFEKIPILFDKVCKCMVRHLNVEFQHEPAVEMIAGAMPCADEPGEIDILDDLRERLLAAARINALTEMRP